MPYPKIGDPIPGTNLKYEAEDIANLQSGGGTPTNIQEETPAGTLPPLSSVGELSNLRIALRSALTEAAQQTATSRMQQLSGLVSGGASPSVINAAIGLAQSGLRQTQETVFGDIMAGYKDATEARQKELDRINELRQEFGSAVPSNVTDLLTALDLVAPLVDKERELRLEKMATEQAEDDEIESWAYDVARDPDYISKVPAKIKTRVKIRADVLREDLQEKIKANLKTTIGVLLDKKLKSYDEIRTEIQTGGSISSVSLADLTGDEMREWIDYVDALEATQKAAKKGLRKPLLPGMPFGMPGSGMQGIQG